MSSPLTKANAGLSAAVLAAVVLSGCNAVSGFKREVDVKFSDSATEQNRQEIRRVCGALPGVTIEPPAAPKSAVARTGDVYFDITKISQRQLAALYACLNNKPGVVGAVEPDDN